MVVETSTLRNDPGGNALDVLLGCLASSTNNSVFISCVYASIPGIDLIAAELRKIAPFSIVIGIPNLTDANAISRLKEIGGTVRVASNRSGSTLFSPRIYYGETTHHKAWA